MVFMIDLDQLKKEINDLTKDYKGFEFKYIDTDSIVVEPWTRLKCQYGCPNYGKTLDVLHSLQRQRNLSAW